MKKPSLSVSELAKLGRCEHFVAGAPMPFDAQLRQAGQQAHKDYERRMDEVGAEPVQFDNIGDPSNPLIKSSFVKAVLVALVVYLTITLMLTAGV